MVRYMQVEQLMERGADVTAKDKRGISALHYAAGQGRLEIIKLLWSKGVDLDSDDPGEAGPLPEWSEGSGNQGSSSPAWEKGPAIRTPANTLHI
jgi:ankyrin repeat protein